jgi:hypothetical protein
MLSSSQSVKIHGSKDYFDNGSVQMRKVALKSQWLHNKYGQQVQPYEISIDIKNETRDLQGKPMVIEYFYSYQQSSRMAFEVEREP